MMRFAISLAALMLCLITGSSEISRQECEDQDGQVVGDIGDGAIFESDYLCEVDGLQPTDVVVAGPDEAIATEGEVCCGGNGTGIVTDENEGLPLDPNDGGDSTTGGGSRTTPPENESGPELSGDECEAQGGVLINDIGDGAIHRDDFVCELSGQPPIGTVIARSGEPMPREGQVCCPADGDGLPLPDITERDEYTRQECEAANGVIIGDIGNGAIFEDDYTCESNGLPPIANIVQDEAPFAIEGEVCCEEGMPMIEDVRDEITRQECEEHGGEVVGDVGDGATQSSEYVCDGNGESPIANVYPEEGEPIASEGEVCCGASPESTTTGLTNEDTDESSASLLPLSSLVGIPATLFLVM